MKKWEKPRLIILVRSRPGESLILYCKTEEGATGDPSTSHVGCYYPEAACDNCSSNSAS